MYIEVPYGISLSQVTHLKVQNSSYKIVLERVKKTEFEAK